MAFAYWQWRMIAPVHPPQPIAKWNGDLYTAYYPVHSFAYRSSKLLPRWNPYQLAGMPFLANYNGVLYPPSFLAAVLPVGQALGYGCALHLALAGVGTFLCARALSLSLAASLLAGLLFMLNDFFLLAYIHPSHLAGYAWVPLVFLAAGRMLVSPTAGAAALLGTVVALQTLTASAQTVCYSTYGMLLAAAVYLALRRNWNGTYVLRLLAAAGLAILIVVLLAAVQVL